MKLARDSFALRFLHQNRMMQKLLRIIDDFVFASALAHVQKDENHRTHKNCRSEPDKVAEKLVLPFFKLRVFLDEGRNYLLRAGMSVLVNIFGSLIISRPSCYLGAEEGEKECEYKQGKSFFHNFLDAELYSTPVPPPYAENGYTA